VGNRANIVKLGLLLALGGCDAGSTSAGVPAPSSAIELRALLPADANPVGVAITPAGKRYVLDQNSGLYRIDDGKSALVFNTSGLRDLQFTDVVALGETRFAVTAENDGFLLDLSTGSFSSYFCYLPSPPQAGSGEGPSPAVTPVSVSQTLQLAGVSVSQRTEAVAFNPSTGQLFAQPRTTRLDTGSIAGSELFVFGQAGGEPIQVLPFSDLAFVAGGMATVSGDRLLLGSGSALYEAGLDGSLNRVQELDASLDISGMARAPDGALWLLDGKGRRLLELDDQLQFR